MHFQEKATTSPGAPNHTPTPHFISVSRIFFQHVLRTDV